MIQKQLQGEKLLPFIKCIEKNVVICQKLSFSCGPLATRLFKNLNSSVYLQGTLLVFFPFTPTLLFPEPRDDLVSGVRSVCLQWCFFPYPISYSKEACKKRKKECQVLLCLIQEEGKEKKAACCRHYQSTFALSDFRVCIIKSWESFSVIGKILPTLSSSTAVQFCTTVITDKSYCNFSIFCHFLSRK